MLTDDSKIRIDGKGTIVIEKGGKNMIIHNVYHVPNLCPPLFILLFNRRIPGFRYHSENNGVF